ncbi:MAG TPA: hypothetical protein VGB30_11115 [bacterium]
MKSRIKISAIMAFAVTVMALSPVALAQSYTWTDGFSVEVSYRELTGADAGQAEVTFKMLIPAGTPLIARQGAINSALYSLRDIWEGDDMHNNVLDRLDANIPLNIQRNIQIVDGVEFLEAIMDSFESVEESGYSRFQQDMGVTATERVYISPTGSLREYGDAPLSGSWVIPTDSVLDDQISERLVMANLINYTAAVLSFRSEFRRFPASLAELRETRHQLVEPTNPYSGTPVREVPTPSPGNITYTIINTNRVVLVTYIQVGPTTADTNVITREINSSGSFDYLYRMTANMNDTDRMVSRYVFQAAQILNEYYYKYLTLPYSVPQMEAEGFAFVHFDNPYGRGDARQSSNLMSIMAGEFTYHRISDNAYYIVGYGSNGSPVFSFTSGEFNTGTGISLGTISAQ